MVALLSPDNVGLAVLCLQLYTFSVMITIMVAKKVWDKPNPKKKSTPLSSAQKSDAKARAKKAGRPYPNLVDNMAASRNKGKK